MRRVRKLASILADPVFRRAFLASRTAASVEHRGIFEDRAYKTVVDVGANIGQVALLMRRLNPGCKVISFEPLAAPAARFRRLFADDRLVTLYQAAIGSTEELSQMHVSRRNDSSSLLPIAPAQTAVFPGTEEVGREQVRVAPLDSFLSADGIGEPALLKMGVQATNSKPRSQLPCSRYREGRDCRSV